MRSAAPCGRPPSARKPAPAIGMVTDLGTDPDAVKDRGMVPVAVPNTDPATMAPAMGTVIIAAALLPENGCWA